MIVTTFVLLALAVPAPQARPQENQAHVVVSLDNPPGRVAGRLVLLDQHEVHVLVGAAGRSELRKIPIGRVVSVTSKHRDSLIDGTLAGLLAGLAYGGLICLLGWSGDIDPCGWGMTGPTLTGAVVGALADAQKVKSRAIYCRPAGVSVTGRGIEVRWRIAF